MPANYTFVATDNGVHVFTNSATLVTAGSQTITATDNSTGGTSGITGSAPVTVNAAVAKSLTVAAPTSAVAGSPFNITVTAKDQFGNVAKGFTGTTHFATSDTNASAVVPANYSFVAGDQGVHVFTGGVKLVTVGAAGTQTVTASDTPDALTSGTATVTMTAAAATKFTLTATTPQTAGTPFALTVTALDAFNNTATGYTGTVHFTKSDTAAAAVVPADYTFTSGTGADNGIHVFTGGVTLATVGSQTVTATDTISTTVTGNVAVVVNPNVVAHHRNGPEHSNGRVGIHGDGQGPGRIQQHGHGLHRQGAFHQERHQCRPALPADYTFVAADSGVHVFTGGVTLATGGTQTVTASDAATSTITGNATVSVTPGAISRLSVTASPATPTAGVAFTVTVTAQDAFGNTTPTYTGKVHFTKSDTAATTAVPADYTFVAGDNGVHTFTNGVTLVTGGNQTVTATDTATASITGNGVFTVGAAAAKTLSVSASPARRPVPHLTSPSPPRTASATLPPVTPARSTSPRATPPLPWSSRRIMRSWPATTACTSSAMARP